MKKIIYFLAITAMLINTTACNEILDQMPVNSVSGTGMWTTEEQVDQGVIGVYAALQRPIQGGGIVGESVDIGYYGYDVLGMTGQGQYAVSNLFLSSVNPGNERFSFTWKWCYTGVHRANNAIAYIPDVPMSETKKARLIAESKILRAFFYSRLNELFGNSGIGVPIYTEPIQPTEATKGQSPEAEVWAQIIKDLTEAIDEPNLPDNQIQGEGRVGKGAAYALRGRADLITKDYDKAVADFAKVGDCGYKLYPDYKKLFKVEQER
ncbi:MAG: RagB/SusD family nutrient uptake outer membrane protein, partial [Prevotella sp.]|nr:RagB/SusD family nutrient uptake outer membrane protein [Prevotella sp.]